MFMQDESATGEVRGAMAKENETDDSTYRVQTGKFRQASV
jgi:hypothetical protein